MAHKLTWSPPARDDLHDKDRLQEVTSVALTGGASLIPTPTGAATVTNYTKPLQLGKWWAQASNINWIDTPLIGANQLCR